jgi:hypothetical protein
MAEERTLFFRIPDGTAPRIALVSAIPSDWQSLNGVLFAPDASISSGLAVATTGYIIDRDRLRLKDLEETIYDLEGTIGLLVERRLPRFVRFTTVGQYNSFPLQFAQRMAIGYLNLDYLGWLNFGKYVNSDRECQLYMRPWEGGGLDSQEAGPQPARVKLAWGSHYGSDPPESFTPIVAVCRELGLEQYIPEPKQLASV